MYTYYTKFESNEHMLNCTEIAKAYGIFTIKENKKPHSRFIAALMSEFYRNNTENTYNRYYYATKNGMMEVYPSTIYKPIMERLISKNPLNSNCDYTIDSGKTHHFRIEPAFILRSKTIIETAGA